MGHILRWPFTISNSTSLVSPISPFLQGTIFAAPTAQYMMAASPDALLVGDGGFKALLEVRMLIH